MNDLTYEQLYQKYEEALETIGDLEMEIRDLKQEVDDYCQAFEELQYELASI
ncbi:MAG: hypothetical protein PHG58_09585 [Clostridia bacterium]|jgi:FtsZ-binding cell division protein ZapB|nr:hypothetical protein [Clostridia bacterium]MDD4729614.1 hypothetical protein [Dysgonamonadaceae bacterium]